MPMGSLCLRQFNGAACAHAQGASICAPMQIVDRVAPVVFGVPTKAREAHAHIAPWHLQRHTHNH